MVISRNSAKRYYEHGETVYFKIKGKSCCMNFQILGYSFDYIEDWLIFNYGQPEYYDYCKETEFYLSIYDRRKRHPFVVDYTRRSTENVGGIRIMYYETEDGELYRYSPKNTCWEKAEIYSPNVEKNLQSQL